MRAWATSLRRSLIAKELNWTGPVYGAEVANQLYGQSTLARCSKRKTIHWPQAAGSVGARGLRPRAKGCGFWLREIVP